MPKVSIIVPVYNVEKYLTKCLESLVNQTLDDYEILVVNDGSPDDSQSIIDKYMNDYPELIKAFNKENGGLSDARNFGIENATGDFIGFVDSDDYVDVTMFEKLYNRAAETDSDIVVCAHNAITLDKNDEVKDCVVHGLENHYKFGKSIFESPEILAYSRSYAWNKLYKREVLNEYRFPVGQLFEDSAVVYNILSAAKKIEIVNEPLYYYVTGRAGAITSTVNERIFDVFKSCDSIIAHYKRIDKFEELKAEIESVCLMHIHARFSTLRKKGPLKLRLNYVDKAFSYMEENFPNWQMNQYYLARRAPYLAAYPVSKYQMARESRKTLKVYYIKEYCKALLGRLIKIRGLSRIFKKIFKKIKKLFKKIIKLPGKIKNKFFDKTNTRKSSVQRARELSAEELRELQLVTLGVLKTVVKFCDEHHLRYYLSEGSLLGAVRHGGFIPWDDDMDIAMPREDYEKFLELWGSDVHDECRLFHQSTYKKYYLTFAKVIFMGECRFSSLIRAGLKSMNEIKGPGIDIFPLDETAPLNLELLKRASKIRKLRNILLTKVYYIKKQEKRKLYRFSSWFLSYKLLHKKLTALYTKDKGKQYVTNFASAYNISKEVFPKEYFEPARSVPFEDIMVTVPNKAEEVLTRIYGDFMTPPSEDKRVCPHQYIVKEK